MNGAIGLFPLVPLSPEQQFLWGVLGGFVVLAFKMLAYANRISPATCWPHLSFRSFLLCAVWLALLGVSGLLCIALEPHQRLIAVFEGASAPALFYFIASHSPF